MLFSFLAFSFPSGGRADPKTVGKAFQYYFLESLFKNSRQLPRETQLSWSDCEPYSKEQRPVDLLVVDESGGQTGKDFKRVYKFLVEVVKKIPMLGRDSKTAHVDPPLNLKQVSTRIGIISYTRQANVYRNFSAYNRSEIEEALKKKWRHREENPDNACSALWTVLVKADEQLNISGRVCSQKAILLVTDGNNFNRNTASALGMNKGRLEDETKNAAEQLKTQFGTDIFLVGIGSNFEQGESVIYTDSDPETNREAMLPLQNIFALELIRDLRRLSKTLKNVNLQTAEPVRRPEPFDIMKFFIGLKKSD